MSIVLQYALPAMGVCKNFPRSLVFVPKDFFGHGIKHLFICQETDRLKDIILHTFNGSITGNLYRASFELLHLELGSFLPLKHWKYERFAALTTDSLANSTWYFLDKNNISLKTDIMVQPPQIGDTVQVEELNKNSSRFV
jgi:hypothetical protein